MEPRSNPNRIPFKSYQRSIQIPNTHGIPLNSDSLIKIPHQNPAEILSKFHFNIIKPHPPRILQRGIHVNLLLRELLQPPSTVFTAREQGLELQPAADVGVYPPVVDHFHRETMVFHISFVCLPEGNWEKW